MIFWVPMGSPPSSNARSTTPSPTGSGAIDPQFVPNTLVSPNPVNGGEFGASIAETATDVIIGAPNETSGAVPGAGQAYVESVATGATVTLLDPSPMAGGSFGFSLAVSGNLVAVGAPGQTVDGVPGAGAAYLFADNGTLLGAYPNPDATPYAQFGYSVALGNDYLAVGAPGEKLPIAAAGAVDLFAVSTDTYRQLISPVPAGQTGFGSSVASDGNLFAIGAPNQTSDGDASSGEVFLYTATTGDDIAAYSNPTPATDAYFGTSVALNGSVLVSGAPGATEGGAAYEFDIATNASSSLPDPEATGSFGASVAVDGSTVLVGAPHQGRGFGLQTGTAYLYSVSSQNVTSALTLPSDSANGTFGEAVAESDGSVAVGAPGTNISQVDSGSAYLFGQVPLTVTSLNPIGNGEFGWSVALGEGVTVVGAPGESADGLAGAGNAYVVPLDSAPGLPLINLTNPTPTAEGRFGDAVAVGDGVIAVGAPAETEGGNVSAGVVEVYNATTDALRYALYGDNSTSAEFGTSLAVGDDVLVVGAPTQNVGVIADAGAAYVFNLTDGATMTELQSSSTGAELGQSVAVGPTWYAVGAPGEDIGVNASAGVVLVRSLVHPSQVTFDNVKAPVAASDARFGASVAVAGDTLAIGAPGSNSGGDTGSGVVYLFNAETGDLSHLLTSPNAISDGKFGTSVATNGATVVVGAPDETAVGDLRAGNVYVFDATTGAILDRFYSPVYSEDGLFGDSVAEDANRIVAGAPTESVGELGGKTLPGSTAILALGTSPIVPSSDYYTTLMGIYAARPDLQAAFPDAASNLTEYADLVSWAGEVVTGVFPDSALPELAPFAYYYALMLVYEHRPGLQVEFPGALTNVTSYQGLLGWANQVVQFEPSDPAYSTLLPFAAYYEELG